MTPARDRVGHGGGGGDTIVAIDVGTQSVRAIAFDPAGTLLAGARVPIVPYVSPRPGCAEQDPELYWRAVGEACRRLLADPAIRADAIAAATITTQRATVVVTDATGTPLRPAMVWLDQCRASNPPTVGGAMGLVFRLTGLTETVAGFAADCEANWLRETEPETWGRVRHYLGLSGFLTHRLVGRFVDSAAAQVGYLPFDNKHFTWAGPNDWKWTVAPIDRAWLPDVVPPTTALGEITASAATATGLPVGLPVFAAAADKACEVLGSGAVTPEVLGLSYGTAATANVTSHRYVEPIPLIPPFPAAMPDTWNLETQVYRGYWMVEWFKREFGHREATAAAARQGVTPEDLFEALLDAVPAGSDGLVLQPYWSPGVRFPGPEARGSIVGFNAIHTRAHVYRAMLEGLAYALREGAEGTAKRTGIALRSMRIAGGGSQSAAAVQLTADVFGLPVSRVHTHETSALGAAIDAAVGAGFHRDVPSAVPAMVRVSETRDPDPQAHETYEALYRGVYLPVYDRVRPLYRQLRRITGGRAR